MTMRNGSRRWIARAAEKGGFTLPTVMLMVFAAFAVASAAVLWSLSAQTGTTRDLQSKTALAAAEAGAHEAMLRYNATTVSGDSWGKCLPTGTPVSDGAGWSWCPTQQAELPDGTTYTYRVGFPQQVPGAPLPAHTAQIISQGDASGVTRRVDMTIRSASSQTPFSTAGIVGLNSITLGTNVTMQGNSATNGDLTLAGNDSVCGTVQVGPGRTVVGTLRCDTGPTSAATQGVTALPPVNQGNVADYNQNGNFFSVNPVAPTNTNSKRRVCFNGRNAAGETDTSTSTGCGPRELRLRNGSSGVTLTLNGGNYSLCKLTMEAGTTLLVANGAKVTIYFDSPENCGYTAATTQLSMGSNTSIQVNGGTAQNLRMLFVGSDTIPTTAVMASNTTQDLACNQDFVIYGPRTDIVLASNSYFCGALAGKTVRTDNNNNANVTIRTSNEATQYTLPGWVDHYAIDDFKECTGTMPATGAPSSGC
jgi:type II secretory pathway pseudopilin PulG